MQPSACIYQWISFLLYVWQLDRYRRVFDGDIFHQQMPHEPEEIALALDPRESTKPFRYKTAGWGLIEAKNLLGVKIPDDPPEPPGTEKQPVDVGSLLVKYGGDPIGTIRTVEFNSDIRNARNDTVSSGNSIASNGSTISDGVATTNNLIRIHVDFLGRSMSMRNILAMVYSMMTSLLKKYDKDDRVIDFFPTPGTILDGHIYGTPVHLHLVICHADPEEQTTFQGLAHVLRDSLLEPVRRKEWGVARTWFSTAATPNFGYVWWGVESESSDGDGQNADQACPRPAAAPGAVATY